MDTKVPRKKVVRALPNSNTELAIKALHEFSKSLPPEQAKVIESMREIGTGKNKNNGRVYVFEVRRDTEKPTVKYQRRKETRHQLGRLLDDGTFLINAKFKKELNFISSVGERVGAHSIMKNPPQSCRDVLHFGGSHLLMGIADKLGITDDLMTIFPDEYKLIISTVMFLSTEDNPPISNIDNWSNDCFNPMMEHIRNQDVSGLFRALDPTRIKEFQKIRQARKKFQLLVFCDNTSISSYSEQIDGVDFRPSKDDASLPQVNVSFLIDQETGEIILYRLLPGNVTDVKTVCTMLKELNIIHACQVEIVMDRGFYSAKNINAMYTKEFSFVIGATSNPEYIKHYRNIALSTIKDFKHYNAENDIYFNTFKHDWGCKINGELKTYSMFVHIYFNNNKCASEKKQFGLRLDEAIIAGLNCDANETQENLLDKFCTLRKKRNDTLEYIKNFDKIEEHIKYLGIFALISNNEKDAIKALIKYRSKDKVEKGFFNLKNRFSGDTTKVYSDEALEGKLFVQSLSVSLSSYIRKKLRDFKLHNTYSNSMLIRNLNRIKKYSFSGEKPYYNEVLLKQADIFNKFEIKLPEEVALEIK
jgi:transposase